MWQCYATHGVVVGALGQRLPGDIIESRDFGFVVRHIVNPSGWKMDVSVGDTSEYDFIWYIQIDDQSQRSRPRTVPELDGCGANEMKEQIVPQVLV